MAKSYINYYGLVFNCPVGNELNHCSFKTIRKLKTKERLAYYDALTEHEKYTLIEKHQRCLNVREKKDPFSRIAIM